MYLGQTSQVKDGPQERCPYDDCYPNGYTAPNGDSASSLADREALAPHSHPEKWGHLLGRCVRGQIGRRKGASTFSFAPHPPTASSALAIDRVEGSPAAT